MNKTIIINMNGIIFHIEEDAYDTLKKYMTGVKRHFAYTPDSDEIVTDIENRIAEMFTELLEAEKKQVIVIKDVEQITAQMGSVSDFANADEEPVFGSAAYSGTGKKLYRDLDERILGGVCAGIGHYFDVETRWIRLILILLVIFGGTGIPLYIILWIVMPKALTRAEKMAMKGEPLNLQNFKKNFDEETALLKANFDHARHRMKGSGTAFGSVIDQVGQFIGVVFNVVFKVICAFIILFGTLGLVATFIMLFVLFGYVNETDSEFFPFIAAINPEFQSGLYFSAFVLITIPLIVLTLFAVRVLTNYKIITKTGSFAMLVIWLTGLGTGIYYGTQLAREFEDEATYSQVLDLKPSPVYVLKLNDSKLFTGEDSIKYDLDKHSNGRIIIDGESNYHRTMPDMDLFIERSDDVKGPTLTERRISRGPDFETALESARKIGYHFTQTDSVLQFDWSGFIGKGELWRDQTVRLVLKVPRNTTLIIDGKLNNYLRDYNLRNCVDENLPWNTPSAWIMTDEGMKCKNDSLYRSNTERE